MSDDMLTDEIAARINAAQTRYGDFASTHEALGVALEEWNELCDSVRVNELDAVEQECIDLAAVLIRLAQTIRDRGYVWDRSVK